MKHKSILYEFLRYVIVGGVAFVVDFSTLWATKELLFRQMAYAVYLATACGFLLGLTVNYLLSLAFVFTQAKAQNKGRSVGAFLVFAVIGLLGLVWTEIGMFVGVEWLKINYLTVKLGVTGLVLIWNFAGRKVLVFR